jgi:hypothetical protein
VPVLLGGDRRLFDNLGPHHIELRPFEVMESATTTHPPSVPRPALSRGGIDPLAAHATVQASKSTRCDRRPARWCLRCSGDISIYRAEAPAQRPAIRRRPHNASTGGTK